ncbi:HSP90 family protein [Paenibacillus soyae]|uniref:HSP90 family protein n=1 Tax=Paenibacillus soyae TaxID=2969249 RepID=A0A9X2MTG8_9BACL|nr:HSP90 family protein [Paenibacillus soyae]MCR2805982.1 HSP90 family protein [Paenibacillus soyae]
MQPFNFQVNLKGIIDLLSNHLYSDPGVFVRELLQNGVDAITARKRLGQAFDGEVKVEVFSSHSISITDNGSGLTEEEIEQFLARIGSSTKREEQDAADDYIGQFGVGLLACFVVSEEIALVTRSAKDGQALEWRGKPDGTYTIKKLEREVSVGTTVYLKAKADYEEYFEYYRLSGLIEKYGQYLPIPILLIEDGYEQTMTVPTPPWRMSGEEAMAFVEEAVYTKPLDIIPLESRLGGARGIAYVLPYGVSLQDEKRHRVYLKNMLLSDKMTNILPPWAFFVNAIINTDSLRPTASREAFQENELFYTVRDELGECIKRYLIELADSNAELFERIVMIHYASLKTMAVEDDELYALFIRHFRFETSYGEMKLADIVREHSSILVAATLDEFRQVARVAKAQNLMVVNGGYVHDLDLMRNLPSVLEQVTVQVLNSLEFASRFEELSVVEQREARPFLDLSDELLGGYDCRSLIRWFEPADIPVLYNTNQDMHFFRMAEESEREANALFAEVVRTIRDDMYEKPHARLCYNYNNPLVRKAIESGDAELKKASIELFYTQALLLGNHVLGAKELEMMNRSLLRFMNMGFDAPEVRS